jgi:hypothetical protein
VSASFPSKSPSQRVFPRRRWLIIAIILLITGLFLYFRSRPNELQHYRAQLLAQGEVLDLDKLAPKRTGNEPDGYAAMNGAQARLSPLWDRSLRLSMYEWQMNSQGRMQLHSTTRPASSTNNSDHATFWSAIETTVVGNRTDLTLLRKTLQNPAKESGMDYRRMLTNQFAPGIAPRTYGRFLNIAALADLHSARGSEESFATMLALMNLTDFMRDEQLLTRQFLRLDPIRQAHTATWYALESRAWDESRLKELQARWENVSILTIFYHSLLMERAFGHANFMLVKTERERITRDVINYPGVYPIPTRSEQFWQWWRLTVDLSDDHLTYLRNQQAKLDLWRDYLRHPSAASAYREFTTLENLRQQSFTNAFFPAKHILTQRLDFGHEKLFVTIVKAETQRLQTTTAIALERHRLQHGRYPDSLEKLIPDFLSQAPQDPMDGRPLRYRLNPDGTFTLWSVGLDGKDDGGDVTMPDPQKQSFPQDARDLVWPRVDPMDLPARK